MSSDSRLVSFKNNYDGRQVEGGPVKISVTPSNSLSVNSALEREADITRPAAADYEPLIAPTFAGIAATRSMRPVHSDSYSPLEMPNGTPIGVP